MGKWIKAWLERIVQTDVNTLNTICTYLIFNINFLSKEES